MYFCPRKAGTKNGAYADTVDVLLEHLTNDETQKNYPFCLTMEEVSFCEQRAKRGAFLFRRQVNATNPLIPPGAARGHIDVQQAVKRGLPRLRIF